MKKYLAPGWTRNWVALQRIRQTGPLSERKTKFAVVSELEQLPEMSRIHPLVLPHTLRGSLLHFLGCFVISRLSSRVHPDLAMA
jgi:hypothetical protein